MNEVEKSLDSKLWHACAGGMVQMPPVNSNVFYFPQGHAEHALNDVDFGPLSRVVPPLILCRVTAVKFLADPDTDEVYAKIRMVPIGNDERDYHDVDGVLGINGSECTEKPTSFAKTLTQSDANNGGGFSVPRYCAETIFPRLDYSADPPVQTVVAKDVHGEIWKFRHIYRGTPRRHLLTTGWSSFVNQKKLVAGDSIVFLREENGNLRVGIRRAKRGSMGGPEYSSSGWDSAAGSYGGFSVLLTEDENKLIRSASNGNLNSNGALKGRGKVRPESVIEAVSRAANGQSFEVVYCPRASTPEFCVKASSVSAAMKIQWCSGMRFKMAFETEDSSRISWFMGTVSSAQVADPIHWPNSPWRLLQVAWDEPDLLQNVKHVSPWLVELMSNIPVINLSPFSAPRKKLRLPQHSDFPSDGQFLMSSFSVNPLRPSSSFCCLSYNTPAGIQGARHARYGLPLADLYFSDKLQLGLFPPSFQWHDQHAKSSDYTIQSHTPRNDNISCSLSVGNSCHKLETTKNVKKSGFLLFGQPILTEQQITQGLSSDAVPQVVTWKSSSDGNPEKAERCAPDRFALPENLSGSGVLWKQAFCTAENGMDTGHCKVFLQSEDIGRTLDLSVIGSYDELYSTLANMFGIESSQLLTHVLYRDATGALKQTGDEPFSDFMKTAKRLTILGNTASNNAGRKLTGLRSTEHGLDSSNQTGPLSIFA